MKHKVAARLELLQECARYLIQSEYDKWQTCLWNCQDINSHPYTIAVLALHGRVELLRQIDDAMEKIEKARDGNGG